MEIPNLCRDRTELNSNFDRTEPESNPNPNRTQFSSGSVLVRFWFGSGSVRVRFGFGSRSDSVRVRFGFGWVNSVRFGCDTFLFKHWKKKKKQWIISRVLCFVVYYLTGGYSHMCSWCSLGNYRYSNTLIPHRTGQLISQQSVNKLEASYVSPKISLIV